MTHSEQHLADAVRVLSAIDRAPSERLADELVAVRGRGGRSSSGVRWERRSAAWSGVTADTPPVSQTSAS